MEESGRENISEVKGHVRSRECVFRGCWGERWEVLLVGGEDSKIFASRPPKSRKYNKSRFKTKSQLVIDSWLWVVTTVLH